MNYDKTYAELRVKFSEHQGQAPFDWNEFLGRPRRTAAQWSTVMLLSTSWVTCACGNQCAVFPRNHWGVPLDPQLTRLGVYFSNCIRTHNLPGARRSLARIEQRSAYLLTLGYPYLDPSEYTRFDEN